MNGVWAWLTSSVLLASVYWPLEWAWPARAGQRWLRARLGTDFLFLSGQYLLWNGLSVGLLVWLRGLLAELAVVQELWRLVALQPFAVQVAEALLLGDLAVYWFHRAGHRFEILWRFHAVHHTAEHVDWLAAHREHPIDGVLTQLSINLPAIMIGFHFGAIAPLVVFRGLWAIFIHSNVRLPLGPLGYLFGSPQWHRWHHAKHPGRVTNFANLSPWCDFLFGTHHAGVAGDEAFELGVPERWPSSYVGQLIAPLLPRSLWPSLFPSLSAPAPDRSPAETPLQAGLQRATGR
jgi:sterol desaturase/sphingolipid hydroxylase (fatty acid hydroxylase superfamily)